MGKTYKDSKAESNWIAERESRRADKAFRNGEYTTAKMAKLKKEVDESEETE